MEELIKNELVKNSKALLKKAKDLSPSYQAAMEKALLFFEQKGIPSKKDEDWKYTNIAKNLSPRFYEMSESIVHEVPEAVLDRRGMLIFNNGIFNKFLSVLPQGMELDSLNVTENFFDSFDSLNFATSISPTAFKIQKNTEIDFPITVVHLVDDVGVNKVISPRITINSAENVKAFFLEIFMSTAKDQLQYTTNAVTKFNLSAGATIEHVKLQDDANQAVHVGLTTCKVGRDANFKSMTLDYGIMTARHNILVELMDKGAETSVHGLFALNKFEHSDVFSTIIHHSPNTTSDQLFKGILAGNAHGAFTGKIVIDQDAQLSASGQLNKNLLLSKSAHVDTRPQLLVHADDVKCSHGATVGQLSREEEFYLESRGISKEKAKRMLCHGFAADVLYKIENQKILHFAEKMLVQNFEQTALNEMNL